MTGYVTDKRLNRVLTLPIAFPQTELRAGRSLRIANIHVDHGQRVELRSLTANIARVLTSGQVPLFLYNAFGICNVGLYRGNSDGTPIAYTIISSTISATVNPFSKFIIEAPGDYRVLIKNNTSNLDLSVVATGAVKKYL
jgi:hypothetical protein